MDRRPGEKKQKGRVGGWHSAFGMFGVLLSVPHYMRSDESISMTKSGVKPSKYFIVTGRSMVNRHLSRA